MIRVGLIGAGVMGADHARILATEVPGVTLATVCDATPERAASVADACGAPDATTDPLGVIDRPDVDAVLIASPDDTHADLVIAAIRAGKPVLCEKPLAPTADACLRVIAAEVAGGRRLVQVGFMRRFDPAYAEMKAAHDTGAIGRAVMMHNFHRNVAAPSNFTGPMAITSSAPHEFDVVRFVLGADYAAVTAFQPAAVDAGRSGAAVLLVVETTRGQLVTIEVNNNAAYGYDVRGEVVGETGSLHLSPPVLTRMDSALTSTARYAPDWRPRFAEAYRRQNIAWARAIDTGIPSPVAASAWDGYVATVMADAGVRALADRRRTPVELADKPALYA